jgi:hypothetical protein
MQQEVAQHKLAGSVMPLISVMQGTRRVPVLLEIPKFFLIARQDAAEKN